MPKQQIVIEYHTQNIYDLPVKYAHWQLQIVPEDNHFQSVTSQKIITNIPYKEYDTTNLFGAKCLNIQAVGPFTSFDLSLYCTVVTKAMNFNEFPSQLPSNEKQLLNTPSFSIDFAHFLINFQLTKISPQNAKRFLQWENQSIYTYSLELMQQLYDSLNYVSGETSVLTSAEDALKLGHGVCQDFAHIFIGLLRQQNIPSRYVSGYLQQNENFRGYAQLHAWVEIFIPNFGWFGLDPTNNQMATHHHIKICHGRNYDDCTPIRGVLETTGNNTTNHQVVVYEEMQSQQ